VNNHIPFVVSNHLPFVVSLSNHFPVQINYNMVPMLGPVDGEIWHAAHGF